MLYLVENPEYENVSALSHGDTQYQSQPQILCWIIFSRSQWIVKLIYFAPITR